MLCDSTVDSGRSDLPEGGWTNPPRKDNQATATRFMKIYHLFPGNSFLLVPEMIRTFVSHHAEMGTRLSEHVFVVYGNRVQKCQDSYKDLGVPGSQLVFLQGDPPSLLRLFWSLKSDEHLILHGIFSVAVWVTLFSRPTLWKRATWVMWGGDVYSFRVKNERLTSFGAAFRQARRFIYRSIRGLIIRRFGTIAALAPGDFRVLEEFYGQLDNYARVFYSTHVLDSSLAATDRRTRKESLRICLGNSASKSNHHKEALDWLSRYKDEDIEVVCPLAYGDAQYAQEVIDAGRALLGNKFRPLTTLMERDDYLRLISTFDILVYNQRRQQGLFVLYVMLFRGKKCFVRSDASVYRMMMDFGVRVFDTPDIPSMTFDDFSKPLTGEMVQSNQRRCQQYLSADASISSWKQLFVRIRSALCN